MTAMTYHFPEYSRDGRYKYFLAELPAFPNLPLLLALRLEDHCLFFGIKMVCLGMKLDYKTQYDKITRVGSKYAQFKEQVPFPTKAGERLSLALEFDGFTQLLLSIQEERVGDHEQQQNLTLFKQDVIAAAKGILAGLREEQSLPASQRGKILTLPQRSATATAEVDSQMESSADTSERDLRDLILFTERRVGTNEAKLQQIYDALFVTGDDDSTLRSELGSGRMISCPHCGKPLVIDRVVLRGYDADALGED